MDRKFGFVGCALQSPAGDKGHGHSHETRREVVVNGTRVKTVDIHAHCVVPEALEIMEKPIRNAELLMDETSVRIEAMDAQGIDVAALSINPF